MRWRDIRFEKPTKADQNEHSQLVFLFSDGSFGRHHFVTGDNSHTIAWMPMSELPKFERVPNPPNGWRYKVDGDVFDNRAQYWSPQSNKFLLAWQDDAYDSSLIYIVPIDPPAPTYRPFANAAEFEPYRDKWIKDAHGSISRVEFYSDEGAKGMSWDMLFRNRTFDDGTPCGVKVSE